MSSLSRRLYALIQVPVAGPCSNSCFGSIEQIEQYKHNKQDRCAERVKLTSTAERADRTERSADSIQYMCAGLCSSSYSGSIEQTE